MRQVYYHPIEPGWSCWVIGVSFCGKLVSNLRNLVLPHDLEDYIQVE